MLVGLPLELLKVKLQTLDRAMGIGLLQVMLFLWLGLVWTCFGSYCL